MHQWDGQTPLEETLDALDTLVRQGKVRYVGCSNFSGWQVTKALGISDRLGLQRFVSQQIHYTLQAREAEYELVPVSLDQGLGILVWSPLAGGLLSGKYRRDRQAPEGSRHLSDWDEPPVYDPERLHDIVDVLVEIGEGHGVSAAQVALAWLLGRPGVSSVVIGARTDEQLADNLAAAELELGEAERARLDEVSAPRCSIRTGTRPRRPPSGSRTRTWPCSGRTSKPARAPRPRTRRRGGGVPIPSTRTPAHLDENLAAAAVELDGATLARIDEIAPSGAAAGSSLL